MIQLVEKSIETALEPMNLWQDYFTLGILNIMLNLLKNTIDRIDVINSILKYLCQANQEATNQCNVEGKYYSTLVRFQFIHFVFVSSPAASETIL